MASSGRPKKSEIRRKFIIEAKYGIKGAFPSRVDAAVVLSEVSYSLEGGLCRRAFKNYVHRNTSYQIHAEKLLIQQLREDIVEMEKKGQKVTEIVIQLVQDYAPCDDAKGMRGCATDIVEFKDEMEKQGKTINISITFANFYRWIGNVGYGPQNMKGLKRLCENDVVLELLQGETMWQSLFNDNYLVILTEEDKVDLLKKATSEERKERVKEDKRLLQEHVLPIPHDTSDESDEDVNDLVSKTGKFSLKK